MDGNLKLFSFGYFFKEWALIEVFSPLKPSGFSIAEAYFFSISVLSMGEVLLIYYIMDV